jgi:hypothetical protein
MKKPIFAFDPEASSVTSMIYLGDVGDAVLHRHTVRAARECA